MGRKRYQNYVVAVVMLCCMLVSLLPMTAGKAAEVDLDYFNARTNRNTKVFEDDLLTEIESVPQNSPVHVTGREKKSDTISNEFNEAGEAVDQYVVYLEIELPNGTIGWASKVRIEQANATNNFYASKDQYLLEKPDKNAAHVTTIVHGESVNVLEKSGAYSQVETNKKKIGWVSSAALTKTVPKYLYAKKTTPFYYNQELREYKIYGEIGYGQQGSITVGTRMEYVTTVKQNGLKDLVYLVITPTKQLCYVDASHVSFVLPTTLYGNKDTTIFTTASDQSKKLGMLKKGEKVTRTFSEGAYYEIKTKTGIIGWVKKADTSFQIIAKAIKSYGTYYTNRPLYRRSGDKEIVYPIGTKITQLDNKFYSIEAAYGKQPKDTAQKSSNKYPLIKGQYPDGIVDFFEVEAWGNVTKSYKTAITQLRKGSEHIKESEQALFKEFNEFRKSRGLNTVEWDDTLYQYAESHFYYMMESGSGIGHVIDDYGWMGGFSDIIVKGVTFGREDTKRTAKDAMKMWLESPGHHAMLIDEYEKAAVIVMYNNYYHQMQISIITKTKKGETIYPFKERFDTFMVKTWYPFLFIDPKFTNNRGKDYTGDLY